MEGKVFDGPVWIQVQQVIRYFEDNFHASYNIRDPRTNATHVVDNWPQIMFAELATNCILHKEYSKHNCVEISIYKDHISFINHNRPVPPVTIEDLNTQTEFKDRKYLNVELKEMFFKLDLIQSYGSGIRRAKNALSLIGSPALIFEPDNDTDDYTSVTAFINEEFARVKAEEEGVNDENETTQKTTQKTTRKTKDVILELIRNKPEITRGELAEIAGITTDGVKYHIKNLREEGIIERVGGDKGGYWKIKE